MEKNLSFLKEKLFTYPITLLIVLPLSPFMVGQAYLVLGHAHFALTALYQIKRGAVGWRHLIFYLLCLISIFSIAFTYPRAITMLVSITLLFHVFTGEVRHLGRSFNAPYKLMTVALGTIICSWLAEELWNLSFNHKAINILVLCMILTAILAWYRKYKFDIDYFFINLIVIALVFLSLDYAGIHPLSFKTFGFIVIAHYFTTYFNVFHSFKKKGGGRAKLFTYESIAVNLVFLVGFILIYFIGTENIIYTYIYNPISFYVWTLMHFITTMNLSKILG